MTANILDGKAIAAGIRSEIKVDVSRFVDAGNRPPCLAAVLIGEDPASEVYVRNKQRACGKAGIEGRVQRLPTTVSQDELISVVQGLNEDSSVDGILVQLPLPKGLDEREVLDIINPLKDVDSFCPTNVGLLMQGRPRFMPCTPYGIIELLHRSHIRVSGKQVVVVGRSDIVGKPMAMLLTQRDGPCGSETANATVTIAHSQTEKLAEVIRSGDIVIVAVGIPEMIRGSMIKKGAVVIDVGINRVDGALVGDVHFAEVAEVASAVTPVPGGVGPLTIAMLLKNTLTAAGYLAKK